MKVFKHIRTILIHKYWVAKYCFKFGLYWQGIVHDLSKFHPTEFFESVKYYTGTRSPIDLCKEKNGYSMAWFHHRGRNKHHYEYWCDNFERGTTTVRMPYRYATEMVCDYIAAGKAYNGKDFTFEQELKWWLDFKMPISKMHPDTKKYVTEVLTFLCHNEGKISNKDLRRKSKEFYKLTTEFD